MNTISIVKEALAATEAGDLKKLDGLVADDFVFAGPVPQPLGKREFMGLMAALIKGLPDWKFNGSDWKESGDQVTTVFQITGTQTGELSLPMPGAPAFPPSGKKVALPKEPTSFTVKNGKLSRLDASVSPMGGLAGVMSQLGLELPMPMGGR